MPRFRTYRNDDPPALAAIWNAAGLGRGAAMPVNFGHFDRAVLSKPYFDPAGMILAVENEMPIGFVHAGFGANDEENTVDRRRGVICAALVRPEFRRQGIGSELLRRAEDYLRNAGASDIVGGPKHPRNAFYFGLYGGSDLCGFLDSDTAAGPFLKHSGYELAETTVVLWRRLEGKLTIPDPRQADLRQQFELQFVPTTPLNSWWQDCCIGLNEPAEFRLVDRETAQSAARTVVWEMAAFDSRWSSAAAGILEFVVRADARRKGLARFLIVQIMRTISEQGFGMLEVQCSEHNAAALALFASVGFVQVDRGRTYIKKLT